MIEASKESLCRICHQINEMGFYVVISCNPASITYSHPADEIAQTVLHDHGTILDAASSITVTDPHKTAVVMYKIDAKLACAVPIFHGDGLDKFINCHGSSYSKNFNGIVLASHKLKMLSFFYACVDVSDEQNRIIPLWNIKDIAVSQWQSWNIANNYANCYVNEETMKIPFAFPRNLMYSRYNDFFVCKSNFIIFTQEICLNVEDYYQSALLREKMCVSNEIDSLEHSIMSAKKIIAGQEQKIDDFNSQISQLKRSLDKYETDLYESRVNADLF